MRGRGALAIVASAIAGGVYWQLVCVMRGVTEPWDAADYWTLWYPASFGLAALGGAVLGRQARQGWLAGLIVSLAQLPVMRVNTGAGTSWPIGTVMCLALAVPVMSVSALAGWSARRWRAA